MHALLEKRSAIVMDFTPLRAAGIKSVRLRVKSRQDLVAAGRVAADWAGLCENDLSTIVEISSTILETTLFDPPRRASLAGRKIQPMTDRFEQIEVRIAYLEQANTQLSDELVKQQGELETLRMQLAALLQRQDAAQSAPSVYTAEEEKPPHY